MKGKTEQKDIELRVADVAEPTPKTQLNVRVEALLKRLVLKASRLTRLSQEVLVEDAIRHYYDMGDDGTDARRKYVLSEVLKEAPAGNGRTSVKELR